MTAADGTLRDRCEEDMSVEAAQQAAVASVEAAAERDAGAGNGVYLATVTEEGVDIQDYDLDEFDT